MRRHHNKAQQLSNNTETKTIYRHNHKRVVKPTFDNESDSDPYDSGSALHRAREATRARCERQRRERRARKESSAGDRRKRRPVSSENNDHGMDGDEALETSGKTMRKNKKHIVSKTNPVTRRRLYDRENSTNGDSDSPGFERIDEAEFRKRTSKSLAGPSTSNYEDYEDVNTFIFHSTSNVGPSSMERRYRGGNDDDTESDEPPVERTYRVDNAPAKESFTRTNGGSDAADSAHIRGNKTCVESVNDNIIACQNEESSGIASGTREKTGSANKTEEAVKVTTDSSDRPKHSTGPTLTLSSSSSSDDSEVIVVGERIEIELSSDDEPNESEKQKVPSRKENKDEINKVLEENEENNTILSDEAFSGEGLQANDNGEREGSSPKHVSNEQQEGKEVHKRNETSDKNNERNRVHAIGVSEERRIKKKAPTAPCSDQSQPAKNSSEAEGMNRLAEDLDSQTIEDSLVSDLNEESVETKEKECDNADDSVANETGEAIVGDEEQPAADKIVNKKLSSLQSADLWQALADSVLGRVPLIESESDDESRQAPRNTPLPIKFKFEDEIPKKVEKTEYEAEIADLFDEMELALGMVQGSLELPEANRERECSPAEETQEARCGRGLHELNQDDVNGLYCIYCHHVELGPRDILPQWERKARRKPGKKRSYYTDDLPEFVDERCVEPSKENTESFNCPDEGTVWDVIPGAGNMYKHQQEGFEFLWKNLAGNIDIAELKNMAKQPDEVGGCIISHAPGTGKTRLTIVFLESYLKVFPDSQPVLIAPASMLLTWEEEFEKWAFPFPFHNLNNREITGKESKNALKHVTGPMRDKKDTVRMVKIYSWDKGGSVLGISYSLFEKLTGKNQVKGDKNKESMAESLTEILLEKPGLVILDEGHTARNETSNIWNALHKLKTDKRVILSGTPFQNNFGELFNMLRLVRPAVANVLAKDKTILKIDTSRKRKHNQSGPVSETIDGAELEKLKSIMLPFVNVHKGTILREKLTGLGDSVILLKPPELQKSLIDTLEGHQSTFKFEYKVALTSVHPYLLTYCSSREKQNLGIDYNLVKASRLNPDEGAKTKFIMELLRLSMKADEKVLIFSQYIRPLILIKDQMKEVFQWVDGKQILQMKGKLDQKHRQSLIKTYNDPSSEARVMLASIKCCSEGISLVGASRVVLLDVVWNPSVERQAICRAYRIGQKKFVHTYHLMTSGTTEGDKYCRQVEKERLSELVFCSSYGESDKVKSQAVGSIKKDTILEQMVASAKLTDMFQKIVYQPKETDLIQNFGLTSDFT